MSLSTYRAYYSTISGIIIVTDGWWWLGRTKADQKADGRTGLDRLPAGERVRPVPLHRHEYVQQEHCPHAAHVGGSVQGIRNYFSTVLFRGKSTGADRGTAGFVCEVEFSDWPAEKSAPWIDGHNVTPVNSVMTRIGGGCMHYVHILWRKNSSHIFYCML